MPVLQRGARELCASPALLLLGAHWGGHIPRGQPDIRVPAPHPTPASFWGPSFGVQELSWTCSNTARGSSALQNTAKSVGDSGKSVIKSRSSGSLMLRKLPVHITDRPQNARLSLLLFLASSCFYSCSLLFPLIWSRCCSCGKMEVCMFYEGEASLTMRAWLLAGCWRGLCAGLSSPGGAWVMLDPSPGHHAAGEGWHEPRSAWFQHQK